MKKGDIMAGLDGYSSAWSLGLYVGGSRDNDNKEEKEGYTSPYDNYAQAMKQERERKRQIRENPEVRKYLEAEIVQLKCSIEEMKMTLKALEAEHRKRMRMAHSRCYFDNERSERCKHIYIEIMYLEGVLHSKEKLLHDALNM